MTTLLKCPQRIAILMTTYNGADYLEEQIESIINQTYIDWMLYIRDDGSNDNTITIIAKYAEKHPNILIVKDHERNIGACQGFLRLLNIIDSDIYMFCDQDDIWLPSKISLSIQEYDKIESKNSNSPIVIGTDVRVVDKNLRTLADSRWEDIKLHPNMLHGYNYIAQCNYIQGNTMLFNKKAKEISLPVASYAIMHDWWIATRVAKVNGIVATINQQTLLYRQHSTNAMGFLSGKDTLYISRLKHLKQVIKENAKTYSVLRKDGYGNLLKFLWYKYKIIKSRT